MNIVRRVEIFCGFFVAMHPQESTSGRSYRWKVTVQPTHGQKGEIKKVFYGYYPQK